MSDHWIYVIPEDPNLVPDQARRDHALDRLRRIAPMAQNISVEFCENVEFFDCGSNFERIVCPGCGAEVPIDWWRDRMDEDFSDGRFALRNYSAPCCKARTTLHDLVYDWPQGFARFALQAQNANIGEIKDSDRADLETTLDCPVRIIYQHL